MERTSLASAVGAALGAVAASGHFSAPHIGEGVMRQRARDAQRREQINAQFGDNQIFRRSEIKPRRKGNTPRIVFVTEPHQSGETGRQLAARLRATDAHLEDMPAKPKRVRKTRAKVAA